MAYHIEVAPQARRAMKKLPIEVLRRLDAAILALEDDPRPPFASKMSGVDNTYRIRVGDFRVLYQVEDKRLLILVVRVGHRRDIYMKH